MTRLRVRPHICGLHVLDRNSLSLSSATGEPHVQPADLLDGPEGHDFDWQLTSWSAALRMLFGTKALLLFRLGFVVLLTPAVLLAAYSLYSNRPTLLVYVFFCCWGYCTRSTSPTGIGMTASIITAIVSVAISVAKQDMLFALSGVLAGVTWLGSCAILGTTAQYIMDGVQSSESSLKALVEHGILKATTVAEPSDQRCISAESILKSKSSPRSP